MIAELVAAQSEREEECRVEVGHEWVARGGYYECELCGATSEPKGCEV